MLHSGVTFLAIKRAGALEVSNPSSGSFHYFLFAELRIRHLKCRHFDLAKCAVAAYVLHSQHLLVQLKRPVYAPDPFMTTSAVTATPLGPWLIFIPIASESEVCAYSLYCISANL